MVVPSLIANLSQRHTIYIRMCGPGVRARSKRLVCRWL